MSKATELEWFWDLAKREGREAIIGTLLEEVTGTVLGTHRHPVSEWSGKEVSEFVREYMDFERDRHA